MKPGPQTHNFRAGTQHLRKKDAVPDWTAELFVIGVCMALLAVGVAIALEAMRVPGR